MNCPGCNSDKTAVNNSRNTKQGVRRYRRCPVCQCRFVTLEQLVDSIKRVAV